MVVIQSTIQRLLWADVYPSTKCTWSCMPFYQWRHPCPLHINWNLHPSSVDALVDVHRRSHSFPLILPREVFLAWHWVVTRPSSCGVVLLLLPLGVGLTGVGLVHLPHTWQTPTYKEMPVSDAMRRSQLWCRMHEYLCWSFTSYQGTSVMIWCMISWGLSSHLSLIFLFPLKPSALTRMRSPGFKPMAPFFQSWYHFCLWASAIDWACVSWRVALNCSDIGYIFVHMLGRGATLRDLCALKWGSKSQLGALACTQTLDNVGCTPITAD